jgi:hypothetical protein
MTSGKSLRASALVLCLASLGGISTAAAVEAALTGAWARDASECKELFSRTGKNLAFKKPVDAFAQAFILSGSQIRTPGASCRIKGVKRSGDRRTLALVCTTSVSDDEVPAAFALLEDGTLRRYLNDADKAGSKYERCSL